MAVEHGRAQRMDNGSPSSNRKLYSRCHCCGRRVGRHRRSSLRYKHPCPHGIACPGADPMWGSYGIAFNPKCEQCNSTRVAAGGRFEDDA